MKNLIDDYVLVWQPVPEFKEPDDRWQGYHDRVTGTPLPYNPPKRQPDHFHPDALGGFDARCGKCCDLRSRRERDR
jgi:hypothetical protein